MAVSKDPNSLVLVTYIDVAASIDHDVFRLQDKFAFWHLAKAPPRLCRNKITYFNAAAYLARRRCEACIEMRDIKQVSLWRSARWVPLGIFVVLVQTLCHSRHLLDIEAQGDRCLTFRQEETTDDGHHRQPQLLQVLL
jgi:hypothetical protein